MGYGLSGLSQLSLRPRRPLEEDPTLSLGARPPVPVEIPAGAADQQTPYGLSLVPRATEPGAAPMDAYTLRPRAPVGEGALAIKSAAGDYGSAPGPAAIKAAAGVPTAAPLSLSPRPPVALSVPASGGSGYESASPPGLSLTPRADLPGRAPAPPLRAYSESYGRFQDERARTGTEQEYLQAHKPQGIGGRIGNALKLGGKLLLQSGLNPLTALQGVAMGAADPNAYNRYNYRTDVEPRSLGLQDRYLHQAGAELGMQNTIEDNQRQQQQMELTNAWHHLSTQVRDDQEREKAQEKLLNDWQARNPGVAIPKQIADETGHPYLSGYVTPARGLAGKAATRHWVLDKNNQYVDLNEAPGPVEGYHDPLAHTDAKPTEADYEAQARAGSDPSGERTRRIDEWMPWAYSRLGVDPTNALPEDRMRAEQLAEGRVDKAMADELKTRTASARVSGRRGERLGTGTSLGPRPSTTPGQKRKLSAAEVKSYADANGWTPDQAASYLRSTGKYVVP